MFPRWIQNHSIETYGRVEVYIQTFLAYLLYGSEWSVSSHGGFNLGVRDPIT
jgi:hypothetical protein